MNNRHTLRNLGYIMLSYAIKLITKESTITIFQSNNI